MQQSWNLILEKITYLTDVFTRMSENICALLIGKTEFKPDSGIHSESEQIPIGTRFSLRFRHTLNGCQVFFATSLVRGKGEQIPLFDSAWLDFDLIEALQKPCIEVIFLPEGQLKITTATSFLTRLHWLTLKGSTLQELANVIENFSHSIASRKGEVETETFEQSRSLALWRAAYEKSTRTRNRQCSDFFTFNIAESSSLIIDSIKNQKLCSWKHWSMDVPNKPKTREILELKEIYCETTTVEDLDMKSGFLLCGESISKESFLQRVSVLSGTRYCINRVLLPNL